MTLRRGLPHQIAAVLGQRIVQGTYPPGESLPPEAELLADFGVSRPVLREAMKLLGTKGLVDIRQKVGTRATAPDQWAMIDPDVLTWRIEAQGADQLSLLRSLTEVRAIVEPAAAQMAAKRATAEEIQRMRQSLDDMAKAVEAGDGEAFIEADLAFHAGILFSCHNVLLLQMNATIGAALRTSRDVTVQVPHSSRDSLPLHKTLLDRISARQPVAARHAAERLIARTKNDISTVLPGVDFDDD